MAYPNRLLNTSMVYFKILNDFVYYANLQIFLLQPLSQVILFLFHFKFQKFDANVLNVLDIQNHYVPASAVFTGVIKYLKTDLMEQLTRRGYHLDESNIQFVVTVPAIWSEAAKQAMTDFSVMVSKGCSDNKCF